MRNPEYQFVSTDTNAVLADVVAKYEEICGVSVRPGSPENLFCSWVALTIIQERVQTNYVGNQNVPSRAEGENLDALADLFSDTPRPEAKPAVCTVRFWISEAQTAPVLIPGGTRVTDASGTLMWATSGDAYIPAGDTYIDLSVQCQTPGVIGKGYTPGQISTIVDIYDYCDHVENITTSDGGSDAATDDEYYELLRASMDGLSSGGSRGSYIYNAKKVSVDIADAVANASGDAEVTVYVLMDDGTIAGAEIKAAVLASCNEEDARPLTDKVVVADPAVVDYNISLTYYINEDATASSADIQVAVDLAVQEYAAWQSGRLGRDINPDKLREFLYNVGKTYDKATEQYVGTSAIKRIVLESPSFVKLVDGRADGTVPQVAKVGTITLTNGGYEDE